LPFALDSFPIARFVTWGWPTPFGERPRLEACTERITSSIVMISR
jgi:hypothetical protein